MTVAFSGPMFAPAEDDLLKSHFRKEGAHYNIYALKDPARGMELLRLFFPKGEASEFAFVLFSTSGVHGTYATIEEIEASLKKYGAPRPAERSDDWPDDCVRNELTFVIVQPRIINLSYGTLYMTLDDVEFLKRLRASSWAVVQKIGAAETP